MLYLISIILKKKKHCIQQQYPTTKNTTMRKNMKGFKIEGRVTSRPAGTRLNQSLTEMYFTLLL